MQKKKLLSTHTNNYIFHLPSSLKQLITSWWLVIALIPTLGRIVVKSPYRSKGAKVSGTGIYILAISPQFLSQLKSREEFEGGLEKGKGKGGERRKKEKSDKTHVKRPL